VQKVFDKVLDASKRNSKPAGILASVEADAERYIGNGFSFVAVGSDLGLLVNGCDALLRRFFGS
jgi:2-keto-3-deoxy-L-rhamnonate aldolase RhmA